MRRSSPTSQKSCTSRAPSDSSRDRSKNKTNYWELLAMDRKSGQRMQIGFLDVGNMKDARCTRETVGDKERRRMGGKVEQEVIADFNQYGTQQLEASRPVYTDGKPALARHWNTMARFINWLRDWSRTTLRTSSTTRYLGLKAPAYCCFRNRKEKHFVCKGRCIKSKHSPWENLPVQWHHFPEPVKDSKAHRQSPALLRRPPPAWCK